MAEVAIIQAQKPGFWHLLAGVIMVLLGVYMWFNPQITLMALALYLGIVFIIVGAGYFMASFSNDSGWYMLVGVLDVLVGVVFVANVGVTSISLPIIFALWCMAVGAIQLVTTYQFFKAGISWGWTLCFAVLGILFGFLILAYPFIGTLTIVALMGTYMMLFGILVIAEYVYSRRAEA